MLGIRTMGGVLYMNAGRGEEGRAAGSNLLGYISGMAVPSL